MPLVNTYLTFDHMERIQRRAWDRKLRVEDVVEELLAEAAEKLPAPPARSAKARP